MNIDLNEDGTTKCGMWKLVPMHPTILQFDISLHQFWDVFLDEYKSMILAAPYYKEKVEKNAASS